MEIAISPQNPSEDDVRSSEETNLSSLDSQIDSSQRIFALLAHLDLLEGSASKIIDNVVNVSLQDSQDSVCDDMIQEIESFEISSSLVRGHNDFHNEQISEIMASTSQWIQEFPKSLDSFLSDVKSSSTGLDSAVVSQKNSISIESVSEKYNRLMQEMNAKFSSQYQEWKRDSLQQIDNFTRKIQKEMNDYRARLGNLEVFSTILQKQIKDTESELGMSFVIDSQVSEHLEQSFRPIIDHFHKINTSLSQEMTSLQQWETTMTVKRDKLVEIVNVLQSPNIIPSQIKKDMIERNKQFVVEMVRDAESLLTLFRNCISKNQERFREICQALKAARSRIEGFLKQESTVSREIGLKKDEIASERNIFDAKFVELKAEFDAISRTVQELDNMYEAKLIDIRNFKRKKASSEDMNDEEVIEIAPSKLLDRSTEKDDIDEDLPALIESISKHMDRIPELGFVDTRLEASLGLSENQAVRVGLAKYAEDHPKMLEDQVFDAYAKKFGMKDVNQPLTVDRIVRNITSSEGSRRPLHEDSIDMERTSPSLENMGLPKLNELVAGVNFEDCFTDPRALPNNSNDKEKHSDEGFGMGVEVVGNSQGLKESMKKLISQHISPDADDDINGMDDHGFSSPEPMWPQAASSVRDNQDFKVGKSSMARILEHDGSSSSSSNDNTRDHDAKMTVVIDNDGYLNAADWTSTQNLDQQYSNYAVKEVLQNLSRVPRLSLTPSDLETSSASLQSNRKSIVGDSNVGSMSSKEKLMANSRVGYAVHLQLKPSQSALCSGCYLSLVSKRKEALNLAETSSSSSKRVLFDVTEGIQIAMFVAEQVGHIGLISNVMVRDWLSRLQFLHREARIPGEEMAVKDGFKLIGHDMIREIIRNAPQEILVRDKASLYGCTMYYLLGMLGVLFHGLSNENEAIKGILGDRSNQVVDHTLEEIVFHIVSILLGVSSKDVSKSKKEKEKEKKKSQHMDEEDDNFAYSVQHLTFSTQNKLHLFQDIEMTLGSILFRLKACCHSSKSMALWNITGEVIIETLGLESVAMLDPQLRKAEKKKKSDKMDVPEVVVGLRHRHALGCLQCLLFCLTNRISYSEGEFKTLLEKMIFEGEMMDDERLYSFVPQEESWIHQVPMENPLKLLQLVAKEAIPGLMALDLYRRILECDMSRLRFLYRIKNSNNHENAMYADLQFLNVGLPWAVDVAMTAANHSLNKDSDENVSNEEYANMNDMESEEKIALESQKNEKEELLSKKVNKMHNDQCAQQKRYEEWKSQMIVLVEAQYRILNTILWGRKIDLKTTENIDQHTELTHDGPVLPLPEDLKSRLWQHIVKIKEIALLREKEFSAQKVQKLSEEFQTHLREIALQRNRIFDVVTAFSLPVKRKLLWLDKQLKLDQQSAVLVDQKQAELKQEVHAVEQVVKQLKDIMNQFLSSSSVPLMSQSIESMIFGTALQVLSENIKHAESDVRKLEALLVSRKQELMSMTSRRLIHQAMSQVLAIFDSSRTRDSNNEVAPSPSSRITARNALADQDDTSSAPMSSPLRTLANQFAFQAQNDSEKLIDPQKAKAVLALAKTIGKWSQEKEPSDQMSSKVEKDLVQQIVQAATTTPKSLPSKIDKSMSQTNMSQLATANTSTASNSNTVVTTSVSRSSTDASNKKREKPLASRTTSGSALVRSEKNSPGLEEETLSSSLGKHQPIEVPTLASFLEHHDSDLPENHIRALEKSEMSSISGVESYFAEPLRSPQDGKESIIVAPFVERQSSERIKNASLSPVNKGSLSSIGDEKIGISKLSLKSILKKVPSFE